MKWLQIKHWKLLVSETRDRGSLVEHRNSTHTKTELKRSEQLTSATDHSDLFSGFDVKRDVSQDWIKTLAILSGVILDRDLAVGRPADVGSLLEDNVWSLAW